MAGKLSFGENRNNSGAALLMDSKAFAEGIAYRASSSRRRRPARNCPHEIGSGAYVAWQLGWSTADASSGKYLGAVGDVAPTGIIPL